MCVGISINADHELHSVPRKTTAGISQSVQGTRYGLDGPGIERRWRRNFSAPVYIGPGAHPASYTMGTGSFLGAKAAEAWC